MSHNNKNIILVGGGTAGHVLPLLAVANLLKEKDSSLKFYYFGSGQTFEKHVVAKERIKYRKVFSGKWRRNLNLFVFIRNIFDLIKVLIGLIQSLVFIVSIKPRVVLSKGGFVSVPVSIATGIMGIPLIIHESDIQLGLANRVAIRFASRVGTAFPLMMYSEVVRQKGFYCGVPLRKEFSSSNYKISNSHILIIGGSLGAKKLNEIFMTVGQKILKSHKVVHITGQKQFEEIKSYRDSLPKNLKIKYRVFSYTEDIARFIAQSKLVISRAGASIIFEVAAFSKKAILVPIGKDITSHQWTNAKILCASKLASIFDQNDKSEKLLRIIKDAINSERNLGSLSFRYSTDVISRVVLNEIEKQEFDQYSVIHMVGVGGISMKGLKYLFDKMGKSVFGSDINTGGHCAKNITDDVDLVVYSSAITKESKGYVEIAESLKHKIPIIKRSEAIGLLMKNKNGISVSGMHGKTTISLLTARMFELDGRDPTYLVGAPNTDQNHSYEYGKGGDFIAEACEYDDSFLDFSTNTAVISNIDEEHLDYFKGGISEIKKHFKKFCEKIIPGGFLIFCGDDKNTISLVKPMIGFLKSRNIQAMSYGFKKGLDYQISHCKVKNQVMSFSIKHSGVIHYAISSFVGKHFAQNATAAFAVAVNSGVDPRVSLAAIANYSGAKRRMEFVARSGGVSFYDDYGHHPVEITVTLDAFCQMFPKTRKVLIYEPHQQSRFNALFADFYRSFKESKFDLIGILPVYRVAGRDSNSGQTSEGLVKKLDDKRFISLDGYDNAVAFLRNNLKKNDIVVTMGATEVNKVIQMYLGGRKYE